MSTHGKSPKTGGIVVGQIIQNKYGDWVRVPKCLGPASVPEHGYLGNHAGERICPRCRNLIDRLHLPTILTCPPSDHGAN